MNNLQRKELQEILDKITVLQEKIQIISDEEQEKIDNTPENLIGGERCGKMEDCVYLLGDAYSSLQEAYDSIQQSIEN